MRAAAAAPGRLQAVVLLLLLAAAAHAVAADADPPPDDRHPALRCDPCIDRPAYALRAIVHGTASDPFWRGLRAAAVQSARDLRIGLDFPLSDAFDPDRMARDIRASAAGRSSGSGAAAASGADRPDALLVTIPSPAVEAAVAEAVAAGVPVFGMNSGYRVAEAAGVLGFVARASEDLSRRSSNKAVSFVEGLKGGSVDEKDDAI